LYYSVTTKKRKLCMSDPLRPVLIMVRGLPGSGKSYLAQLLQKRLGGDVVMLDPDGTDYTSGAYASFSAKLTSEGVDEKLHPYRYLRAQAYEGITDHKVIIWNQAFTNNDLLDRTIKNLQAYAAEHNEKLPAMVVLMLYYHNSHLTLAVVLQVM